MQLHSTMSTKIILSVVGVSMILLSIFLLSLFDSRSTIDHGDANVDLLTVEKLGSKGVFSEEREEAHIQLNLSYPKEMRVSDTFVVSLKLSGFIDRAVIQKKSQVERERFRVSETPELGEYGAFRLSSSGFEIEPEQAISKPPETRLPTEYAWTISPKREGEHSLLLDLSGYMRPLKEDERREAELSVNGETRDYSDTDVIRLAVMVTTPFGIKATTLTVLRGLVALVGFILTYPLVSEWLKKRTVGHAS